MAERVVLHVGLMKSGTSYLQQRLTANRDLLAAGGVLFPGQVWRDQVLAVSDVLGRKQAGPATAGRWRGLVDEVAEHDGTAVVSMEFLGPARPERIAEVVGSFGETPVEVVLTLRDLGRGVPAMWQEALQNGGTLTWHGYVDLLHGKRKPAQAFWRQQGMARIVGNWVAAVGPDRVTIVTVPPPGAPAGVLWDRFCAAARIPGEGCVDVRPANTSLDAASAVLLRSLNEALAGDEVSAGDYHTLVKFGLAKRVLAGRTDAPAIGFEPPEWLRDRSAEIVVRLGASGARVVGDLADLVPTSVAGVDPDGLPAEAIAAAAVAALRGSVVLRAGERRQPTVTSETV
ncbi:hypothetical protein FB382_000677 [Nocardioides ginsengisegetis]|uniref:Sulfotransferase family protein n=1 Tax=Nocardioides ginsengisegetis TaxID=661491 RepID=A0A7W3IXC0_9ACTN|nr:hypothetical protein [Nocardioides ginsengisegetis]MBA8802386.1 hypothetical protein [Nocardioides ginsengisegetis]